MLNLDDLSHTQRAVLDGLWEMFGDQPFGVMIYPHIEIRDRRGNEYRRPGGPKDVNGRAVDIRTWGALSIGGYVTPTGYRDHHYGMWYQITPEVRDQLDDSLISKEET